MNARYLIALVAVILHGWITQANDVVTPSKGITVVLRYGTEKTLSQESRQVLYRKAMDLLESSNFNSRTPLWDWNLTDILEGYRKTVSRDYVLISFAETRRIKTVGGDLVVKEVLIGLSGLDYASPLYTIDEELRIVGHTKYSGIQCIELLKWIKDLK